MNLAELAVLLRDTTPLAETEAAAADADDIVVFAAAGSFVHDATVTRDAEGRITCVETTPRRQYWQR